MKMAPVLFLKSTKKSPVVDSSLPLEQSCTHTVVQAVVDGIPLHFDFCYATIFGKDFPFSRKPVIGTKT